MIVALMGSDASGKTTVAKSLASRLGQKQVTIVDEFNGWLVKLLKIATQRKPLPPQLQPIKSQGHSRVLPYFIWFEQLIELLLYKFSGKRTIVMDRCSYDYLSTWRELNMTNALIERLYTFLLPKPDLIFYLSVKPEKALERRRIQGDGRRSKDIEFYKNSSAIYNKLSLLKGVYTIDNNGDIGSCVSEITNIISIKRKLASIKTIALSGLDGAGKTTTINELSVLLSKMNVPHRCVHFYYNYIPIKVLRLLRTVRNTDETSQYKRSLETEAKHTNQGKSKVWVAFVLGDAFTQYFFTRIFSLGQVVIYDRFFPDYLVSFDFLNVKHDKEKLLRIFPKPNRYFLQIADYKILHERKPEHTLEFFKKCHAKYTQLARETGMVIVDSTKKDKHQILEMVTGRL